MNSFDFSEYEFIYMSEGAINIPLILNTWKDDYYLVIICSEFDEFLSKKHINMLLARKPKPT